MAKTKMLSKDEILKAEDLEKEVVDVPEWGGAVTVQTMTAKARDDFESEMLVTKADGSRDQNLANFRARLCAKCMININGKLLFPNPEDIKKLGGKSASALDRVFATAQKLNGIGAKDVEELTKN